VLDLSSAVHNITVRNCYIHRPYYTSSSANAVYINASGFSSDNINLDNNDIQGGYYGIYIYGSSSSRMQNVVISNNTIREAYYYGLYHYYIDGSEIYNNKITSIGALSTTASYGMRIYYSDSVKVTNNLVHASA